MSFADAKIIVFDLDSTLAESKSPLTPSMSETLQQLLSKRKVAVISGGNFNQFEKQFLTSFKNTDHFENLYLMPTTGTRLYVYLDGAWSLVYSKDLNSAEKQKIRDALTEMFLKVGYEMPHDTQGELIQDRGSQIAFSALGQDAPLDQKKLWDPDHKKREHMVAELQKLIPEFTLSIGGTTTIDITAKGDDKATGVESLQNYLKLTDEEMLFVGDALFPGGNDYPVVSTGVECIKVENPTDTERLIQSWLKE